MNRSVKLISIFMFTIVALAFVGCGGGGQTAQQSKPPAQTYIVTFDSRGGSAVASISAPQSGTVTAPTDPIREEYSFNGWYSDQGLTSRVTFPYSVTQNTTLYAGWIWLGIEIRTPAELRNIREDLTGNYRLAADISLTNQASWEPIGTETEPFQGRFNGNGYTITGLSVGSAAGRNREYAGFFGYVVNSEIKNLILEDVVIFGRDYAGAIAGYIYNSEITDSSVIYGEITSMAYESYAGGITGYALSSTITGSESYVSVFAYSGPQEASAGGIAGYAGNSIVAASYSWGDSTAYSESFESYAGGMVGHIWNSEITNSHSYVDVIAMSDGSESLAGGIAGYANNSEIIRSYSRGDIIALSDFSTSFAGGIAGEVFESTVTNCAAINESVIAARAGRVTGSIIRGNVSNNFALVTMIGDAFNETRANHGDDRTDAELRTRSTYVDGLGWGFGNNASNPWRMSTPDGSDYPVLYWQ